MIEKLVMMQMKKKNESGFTLIELSMVFIIVGLLMIPLLQMYQMNLNQQKREITKDNIRTASSAMGAAYPTSLPCPSDRSLNLNSADFGVEQCNLAAIPNCNASLTQGICKTNGSRDADGVGGVDKIVIGGVPFKKSANLKISGMYGFSSLDGWNRKLTYAVSANLMDHAKLDAKMDFKLGVINAVDELGNQTAGVTAPGEAQYVILSHGEDGAGAFDYNGGLIRPCPPAPVIERNNCNNDFTFVQGIGSYEGDANSYLDDYSIFFLESSGDLWDALPDSINKPSSHINNLNKGRTGVRTTNPQVKLDVAGTINADTVRVDTLCNKAGTTCFPTSFFGSPHECPAGQVMIGYSGSNPICDNPVLTLPAAYPGVDCHSIGVSYWVKGILTNGCVICSNGATDIKLPAGAPCN